MKISIIIPAYNEELYLKDCLLSIQEFYPTKIQEVIVVDNGSSDKTTLIAREFSFVTVISQPKKGANYARQKGFESSQGDILAFIDADTYITKRWIDTVRIFFTENKEAVSLSGPCKYYDGSPLKNACMQAIWWIAAPITYILVGYMVLSGNFVVRRESLQAIGGFDVSIPFYGDDASIAKKLVKIGPVVFNMNFFLYTSSRRFVKEGMMRTNITYALNFLWPIFFHRSFTKEHHDVRIPLKIKTYKK